MARVRLAAARHRQPHQLRASPPALVLPDQERRPARLRARRDRSDRAADPLPSPCDAEARSPRLRQALEAAATNRQDALRLSSPGRIARSQPQRRRTKGRGSRARAVPCGWTSMRSATPSWKSGRPTDSCTRSKQTLRRPAKIVAHHVVEPEDPASPQGRRPKQAGAAAAPRPAEASACPTDRALATCGAALHRIYNPETAPKPPSGTVTDMLVVTWPLTGPLCRRAAAGAIACGGSGQPASDLKVDGSSTVFVVSEAVAEEFHRSRTATCASHRRAIRHGRRISEVLPRRDRHQRCLAADSTRGNRRLQGSRHRVHRAAHRLRRHCDRRQSQGDVDRATSPSTS